MAVTLVYANIDYPYDFDDGGDVVTTGEVASDLEDRYGLKRTFHYLYKDDINQLYAQALSDAMLDFATFGTPIPTDKRKLFREANRQIDVLFRRFLNSQEVEYAGIPNVPTQAALMGYSRRLKKRTGKRRPSFIDTGQYRNSSKSYTK